MEGMQSRVENAYVTATNGWRERGTLINHKQGRMVRENAISERIGGKSRMLKQLEERRRSLRCRKSEGQLRIAVLTKKNSAYIPIFQ